MAQLHTLSHSERVENEVVITGVSHGKGQITLCGLSSPSSGPGGSWRKTAHSADIHESPASIPAKDWLWENQYFPYMYQLDAT